MAGSPHIIVDGARENAWTWEKIADALKSAYGPRRAQSTIAMVIAPCQGCDQAVTTTSGYQLT
jgi:hypothetical protein